MLGVALLVVTASGCSLLFDGSKYRGGGGDAGDWDAQVTADGGAGGDGGALCGGDPCDTEGQECIGGACVQCDEDGDGYYGDTPGCADLTSDPLDCDDTDDTIYPGAPPICGDGIDQSCLGSTVPFFGLADEFGAYADQEVTVPTGSDPPGAVHVFVTSPNATQVFFLAGDSSHTPYAAALDISPDPEVAVSPDPLEDQLGITLSSGPVRMDAVRDSSGDVRVGLLAGDSMLELAWATVPAGTTTYNLDTHRSVSVSSIGETGFFATGQAAFVEDDAGGGVIAVAGSVGMTNVMLAFDESGMLQGPVSMMVDPGPRWLSSAGGGVVAPGTDGVPQFWPGTFGSGEQVIAVTGSAPMGGTPSRMASILVRGPAGDTTQLVTLAPYADHLQAYALQCSMGSGSSVSTCTSFAPVPPPPPYGGPLAAPLVAVQRISSSALLILYPGATEDDDFRLAIIETDTGLPATISPIDVFTAGSGTIRDLSLDVLLIPAAPGAEHGRVILSYGYVRESPAEGRHLYVSSYAGCFGYGTL